MLGLTGGADAAARGRLYPPHEFIAHCERLSQWQAKAAREQRIRQASRVPGVPQGAERAELLRRVYARYAVAQGQVRAPAREGKTRLASLRVGAMCVLKGIFE